MTLMASRRGHGDGILNVIIKSRTFIIKLYRDRVGSTQNFVRNRNFEICTNDEI